MDSVKASLERETKSLINAAYSDYQAALKKEASLQGYFNAQKQESIKLNSNAIAYNTLKNEIDNNKSLLDSLVKRQGETGVSSRLKGVGVSNIRIVDRAKIPLAPSSPRKKLDMILSLIVGLIGGFGLAFLLEYLDSTVKGAEDVEKYAQMPALGTVAAFDPNGHKKGYGYGYGYGRRLIKKVKDGPAGGGAEPAKPVESGPAIRDIELITHVSPKSNFSESYRAIRTAILLSTAATGPKVYVVSSALPSEGKSSTISNLAVTMAQTGKKVLLIDADLRKPRQHRIFEMKNVDGLTNYLSGMAPLSEVAKATSIPGLSLINAGPVPPNPAELLGSARMAEFLKEAKKSFDIILIDTPPILAVTDALVMGSGVDGIILVIWSGKTSREALKRAKKRMDLIKVKPLGVIVNRVNVQEHDYYYKHQYSRYYEEV
jgi:capsular exopolysaccharide synthesis family protein